MKRNRNFRFVMGAWGAAIVVMTIIIGAHAAGLRFNETASVPIGLWRVSTLKGALQRGNIVSFCPPDNAIFRIAHERGYIAKGACPSGLQPLLKPVAAIPGDIVVIDETGIMVNGIKLAHSQSLTADRNGRPLIVMPKGMYRVSQGEFWLLSDKTASFDSRYFGPMLITKIEGIAQPIWIITKLKIRQNDKHSNGIHYTKRSRGSLRLYSK